MNMHSWQQWLEQNYKVISYWSRRWHPHEWRELLAFLTLYLEKNWHKFSKIPDGDERIKFLQKWMKNNVNWSNSEFRKSIEVNNFGDDIWIPDEVVDDMIDIRSEDSPEDVKEFIIDLHRRFSEEEVIKIIKVRKVYITLKAHEKVLFDLYITQMLSIRGVAKRLNLPMSAVYGMINDLKKKIQDEC
jgi:hypothetical protein